jgi:hypothetical protein
MTPTPQRVGVRLGSDEWAVVLEALRRFALEHDAVGRPDVAAVAHRALSRLVTYASQLAWRRWTTWTSSKTQIDARDG